MYIKISSNLKILDRYIIRSFLSPYIISFLIAEFVLVMQFMWKYIDEFAGRGLTVFDFLHLLFYYSITVIPMAIPITILLSSVMVYGNLSEKYELSSMKSAGISLIRIMMPGFFIAILTFIISISVSNYFKPKSAYKFLEIFTAIKRKKPTLNIQEKIFNKDFNGYAIQVNKKHKDGKRIEDIKIYNYSDRTREQYNITTAKKGDIFTTKDGSYFIMRLYDGYQYVEKKNANDRKKNKTFPLMRTHFDTLEKSFDMTEFNREGTGHFFSKRRDLMNTFQLMTEIDTFSNKIERQKKMMKPTFNKILSRSEDYALLDREKTKEKKINKIKKINNLEKVNSVYKAQNKKTYSNTYKQKDTIIIDSAKNFIVLFDDDRQFELIQSSSESINYEKNRLMSSLATIDRYNKYRDYWILGLNQIYSWGLICVIFLFIGAPLGSIIRKGGYGYPVLFAILFFTIFIMLSISGEKLNRSGFFNPVFNAWLPVIVLLPVSIFLSYKALTDSKIMDISAITGKLFNKKKSSDEKNI
ncbi:MAG TPA: YjgP/YjgQ family permease [Bacteroidetes bacterium]|nr:YjgP/YjgQ family permease [Bacteroidota bacterium]